VFGAGGGDGGKPPVNDEQDPATGVVDDVADALDWIQSR
jgi:hypothetical protein